MPWINLARLLVYLRRRGVDPREVTVYLNGEMVDIRQRSSPSAPFESGIATGDDEPISDEYDDGDY